MKSQFLYLAPIAVRVTISFMKQTPKLKLNLFFVYVF